MRGPFNVFEPMVFGEDRGEGGRVFGDLSHEGNRLRLRSIIEEIVANVFHVNPDLLRQPTRGQAKVALARQVAMYVAHIGYGLTLTEVGLVFGRDRTTVAHACSVVETRRDCTEFDGAIRLIEYITRAMNGAWLVRQDERQMRPLPRPVARQPLPEGAA